MSIRQEVQNKLSDDLSSNIFVGVSVDLARARDGAIRVPAVFVLMPQTRAGRNTIDSGVVRQLIEVPIRILIMVSAAREISGGYAQTKAEEIAENVSKAIYAYQPKSAISPIEYVGGNFDGLFDAKLAYFDNYKTQFIKSSTTGV